MAKVLKIALPGYNAETDTDPNHFALYVDQVTDYILIKEKTIGTVTVGANSSATIAHGLSYIPLVFAFAEVSSGVWRKVYSTDVGGVCKFTVDDTNVTLYNTTGSDMDFSYHIFYDNLT